jgi:tetratricopeptide (TPR) repeat protein
MDLLNKWVFAFYYRGDFKGLTEVLTAHADLADSEEDMTRVGLFYFGLGLMEWERVQFRAAYEYLHKALEIGEKIGSNQIIGYACTLLAFTYAELGRLGDEAVAFGKRANEIAKTFESDHFLYFKSLLGLAHIYVIRGESRQPAEISKMLLEYGQKFHNIRSLAVGHACMGYSHYAAGNFPSAIECFQQAAEIAVDPFYYHLPRYMTGLSYVRLGEFHNAEAPIKEVLSYSQNIGCDIFIDFARACLGIILISRGDFSKGLNLIEEARQSALKSERKWLCAVAENLLGNVYSQIGASKGPASLSVMTKNAGFLMKNIPFAAKKAEDHFKKAIEVSKEIGAPGLLAQSYFNLGLLCKAKRKTENAKEHISAAIKLFEECEAEGFLKQAREALGALRD